MGGGGGLEQRRLEEERGEKGFAQKGVVFGIDRQPRSLRDRCGTSLVRGMYREDRKKLLLLFLDNNVASY